MRPNRTSACCGRIMRHWMKTRRRKSRAQANGARETGAYRELCLVEHVYPQNVDYMNPDAIRLFLDVTHEEYKKRYGAFFGKSIPGIFFDEIYMTGKPLPWTEKLPERFEERYGYSVFTM